MIETKRDAILAKLHEVQNTEVTETQAVEDKETGTVKIDESNSEVSSVEDSGVADGENVKPEENKAKEEVKPEAKHTYENRVKQILAEREATKAELEKERARVKDLEEKLAIKASNSLDDLDLDDNLSSDEIKMTKVEFEKMMKENLTKFSQAQEEAKKAEIINQQNERLKKILSDKYSSRYDESIGGFDDEATEELKIIGDLYKTNNELWLKRIENNGIDSVIDLVRGTSKKELESVLKKAESAKTIEKSTTKVVDSGNQNLTLRQIIEKKAKELR